MEVTLVYYFDTTNPKNHGSFVSDFISASDEALKAGDRKSRTQLKRLWLDYLAVTLPAKSVDQLMVYLATRNLWKTDGDWKVYKTANCPCVAYTAQMNSDDSVTLIALGAVYSYPKGGDQAWWVKKIRPRVRSL